MAIANADGSIILSTKLDTSGVSKGLTTIRNKFAALKDQKATISTLTQAIKDQQYVLDKLNIEYAEFVAKGKQNSKQAQELKGRINDLTAEMKEMQAAATTLGVKSTTAFSEMKSGLMALASYLIGIQTIFAAFRFSGEAGEFATQTEASVQRLVDIYGSASDSVGNFIDANARALGMSKAAAASFSSVYGNLFSVWADQATNAELTNRYLNMTAVVASKTGRTVEDVQERVRSGLLGNTEAIEDLGIFVNVKTIEMTEAFQRMANGESWEQLDAYTQQQIRSMAILEQATAKYGDEVADTSATIRNRYKAAYEDFQNSWGNIVNTVLLPVLQVLTQIFDIATKGLNALLGRSVKIPQNDQEQDKELEKSKIFNQSTKEILKNAKEIKDSTSFAIKGQEEINKKISQAGKNTKKLIVDLNNSQNIEEARKNVQASEKTADNIKKQTKNQKDLNKELKKATASFDTIEILSSQTAENTSGGLDGGFQSMGGDLGGNTPDGSAYVEEINAILAAIMKTVAISMIAIGLILLFTGNVGWGIGAIIFGVGLEGISSAAITESDPSPTIINSLLTLQGVAIGASIALGIMMIFVGSKGLGVGLIAYGALQLGITIYEIGKFETNDIEKTITTIEGIAAGAMLALGFFLLYFKTNKPLAISLIAGGALLLVDNIVDIVEGGITPEISSWINGIMLILEGAVLVIGIILLATKANIPLGISLVATGAATLGKEVAVNWDAIVEVIRGPIGAIMAIAGTSLVAIGLLVALTGGGLPLGLSLIAAGATSFVTSVTLNKDAILDWIKGIWRAVENFWDTNISPIFASQWWLNLGKGALNGLIWAFELALNVITAGLRTFVNGASELLNAVGGVIGFDWDIPKIPEFTLPRLAQGAVIPPNREFLAVLGDQKQGVNIEAPLQTIVDAFNIALSQNANYNGSGNTEVVLEIDGREFGRAVVEQGNRENRRIGTRLVIA